MRTERATIPAQAVAIERAPQAGGTRIHYVDWLRALAVLGVFVYHSLQPFSTHDWHVKNDQLSGAIEAVISFIDPWGIAFFFLIAGASTFLALRWRTPRQYVGERLMRLLVPLVVAYLLLSPVQAFIEERHFGRYTGSFLSWLPLFLQGVWSNLPDTLSHPLLVDRTYHLWFVVFLLWFSLLGVPIFLWLRGPGGRRLSAWAGERAGRLGWTLLFAVPVAVLPVAILPLWPDAEDWGSFAYLFGFFVAGYVLMSDPRLTEAVRRDVVIALLVAIAVDAMILVTGVPGYMEAWQDAPSYSWMYLWSFFAITVQAWAWVQFLLGLGMRARSFRRPLPRSVGAAAMPFFLIHQPVILAIAFFVVRWDAGIAVKWGAIALTSFVATAGLATALARLPIVSTMFGVKRPASSVARRESIAGPGMTDGSLGAQEEIFVDPSRMRPLTSAASGPNPAGGSSCLDGSLEGGASALPSDPSGPRRGRAEGPLVLSLPGPLDLASQPGKLSVGTERTPLRIDLKANQAGGG